MSLIINIDTATATAQVSIAKDGLVVSVLQNEMQQDHAAFLQPAISELLQKAGIAVADIAAIAVTAGPGSYTGLRVGMASAKGLSYALNKPMVAVSTLEVMANAATIQLSAKGEDNPVFICPMIDARRMEVFTAVYNRDLTIHRPPVAIILDAASFGEELAHSSVIFVGNGSDKWKKICAHPNASFTTISNMAESMAQISLKYYRTKDFANLAYSEPFYLKEFQNFSGK